MPKKPDTGDRPTRPRTPLDRNRILATAVQIADERGVGAVTMREVGSRLGVEAMSLYNHVANKDDILDGMLDLVIEQFDLPADVEDWQEAMRARALSARRVFGCHPWAPALLDSRGSSGPSRLRYYDWVLGTLVETGFSLEDAARAFSLLDSYVYGFGIQQSNFSGEGDASSEEMAAAILESIPPEVYPHLHRMAVRSMEVGYDAEADFEFGLEIILDGLQRALAATKRWGCGESRGHTIRGVRMTEIRQALRRELENRGLQVADDTFASRNELYVKGDGDLAAALFEFKQTAQEATDTMYQGHWTEGLPPRFAVLPADSVNDPYFEMLEQMRIIPLLYELTAGSVIFPGLDEALARLGR